MFGGGKTRRELGKRLDRALFWVALYTVTPSDQQHTRRRAEEARPEIDRLAADLESRVVYEVFDESWDRISPGFGHFYQRGIEPVVLRGALERWLETGAFVGDA